MTHARVAPGSTSSAPTTSFNWIRGGTPGVEDQATDRTHRIGQTKPVTVIRMIATDTTEELIDLLRQG
jgi:hypothetical protein